MSDEDEAHLRRRIARDSVARIAALGGVNETEILGIPFDELASIRELVHETADEFGVEDGGPDWRVWPCAPRHLACRRRAVRSRGRRSAPETLRARLAMALLWELTVSSLRHAGVTREIGPRGRDRDRVRQILWELYMLGERPSPTEIRVFGGVDGVPTTWSRHVADLWRERLSDPTRTMRHSHWARAFGYPAGIIERHSLESVERRLGRELVRATDEYVLALESVAPLERLQELDDLVRLQALALRTWGQTVGYLTSGASADDLIGIGYRLRRESPPLVRPIERPPL
jgi:hypothetical protein